MDTHNRKRTIKEKILNENVSVVSDLPKATKDCRVCNRRRIKCDRTTPSCKKCTGKKLTCPGYGLNLNWEWGVASRGKLAGKKVPKLSPEENLPTPLSEKSPSPISTNETHSEYGSIIQTSTSPSSVISVQFQLKHDQNVTARSGNENEEWMEGSNNTNLPADFQPSISSPMFALTGSTSGILQDSASRQRLFHHYCQYITGTMVWVDIPDNPWRKVIMPMALQSTPLLISVLAFAAQHLSAILPENAPLKDTLIRCATKYRDAALTLITSDMRSVATAPGIVRTTETSGSHQDDLANSVLASMLILCNMETVQPGMYYPYHLVAILLNACSLEDSKLWRVHLDAARTIVNLRRNAHTPQDETFNFLVQQFFITDVFACTTSFAPIEDHDILTDDAGSIFIEFLQLIRRITWLERLATAQRIPMSGGGISSSRMRALFEHARDRTLKLSANTPFATPTEREQFLGIVDSFHYAGLLYSYRCLSYSDADEDIFESRERLFHSLNLVESDKSTFAQDVCWPLFIAGTEAESKDGTRDLVEQKLNQAMKSTGFSNCIGALTFLRALWLARDGGENHFGSLSEPNSQQGSGGKFNWIQCARKWTAQGHQFFVI